MQTHTVPKHIAIIPDGNRRWATAQGKPGWRGHEEGAKRFEEVAEEAFRSGCTHVTFWGASVDNLAKRTLIETTFLFKVFRKILEKELKFKRFIKNQIKIHIIGKWADFDKQTKTYQLVKSVENAGKDFQERVITILFGYDGKMEMLEAIEKLKQEHLPTTEQNLKDKLWTKNLPPVDLVIRTGGEPHWSAGFLMWHTADSQFYFTEKLWPDFGPKELQLALADFAERGRRFGK